MQSELDVDIYQLAIAARRSPQGTIPLVAVGSMGSGAGNNPAIGSVADTDPQLTVDTTGSTMKRAFFRLAVSRKR
jgi:hypothetical protein